MGAAAPGPFIDQTPPARTQLPVTKFSCPVPRGKSKRCGRHRAGAVQGLSPPEASSGPWRGPNNAEPTPAPNPQAGASAAAGSRGRVSLWNSSGGSFLPSWQLLPPLSSPLRGRGGSSRQPCPGRVCGAPSRKCPAPRQRAGQAGEGEAEGLGAVQAPTVLRSHRLLWGGQRRCRCEGRSPGEVLPEGGRDKPQGATRTRQLRACSVQHGLGLAPFLALFLCPAPAPAPLAVLLALLPQQPGGCRGGG